MSSVVQSIINGTTSGAAPDIAPVTGTPGPGLPLDPALVPTPGVPAAEARTKRSTFLLDGGIISRLANANGNAQVIERLVLQLEAHLLGKAGGPAPDVANPEDRIGLQMGSLEAQLDHLEKRLLSLLEQV